MKAICFEQFGGELALQKLPDPTPTPRGVVIRVEATGLCRSDWHGWQGHDPDIVLPHVPGHEFAGVVVASGSGVQRWKEGDRVTVPFVGGCGSCGQCTSGNQQICDYQFQPGFTHWGSFAELVAVDYADENLVRLPETLDFVTAASLGCRFITSFRAVVDQGRTSAGEWLAVHGCGGVGLSAIMIGKAIGANVIAVDIDEEKLAFAKTIGADAIIHVGKDPSVVEAIRSQTSGGAHVSIDALGSTETCVNSIACLRKRGRHIQVGLMVAKDATPAIPMGRVIADELELLGSHGMQAHRYPQLLSMIENGALEPSRLIGARAALVDTLTLLPQMDRFGGVGVTVVDRF